MNALPGLAPAGMTIKEAPSFADFPLYNADVQNASGFPGSRHGARRRDPGGRRGDLQHAGIQFFSPGGLKNALDWVSRLKEQPFVGKPCALQSASAGPVGGARVQYDLRKMLVFLDAVTLNKPEVFVGLAASRLDEGAGEIKDEATRSFIKQQLEAFATFIRRQASRRSG